MCMRCILHCLRGCSLNLMDDRNQSYTEDTQLWTGKCETKRSRGESCCLGLVLPLAQRRRGLQRQRTHTAHDHSHALPTYTRPRHTMPICVLTCRARWCGSFGF